MLVAQQILQSLGLRSFAPQVTACPGCGRTTSTFFQQMAEDIQTYLREQMPVWRERIPGRGGDEGRGDGLRRERTGRVASTPNIGISLPGTFEEPKAPVYVDGKLVLTLKGDHIVPEFLGFSTTTSRSGTPEAAPSRLGISDYLHDLRAKIGHDLLLTPGVAAVILNDAGHVLLQRRSDDGEWGLPGGAMEPGEEPAESLVREVREETALEVVPERIVGVYRRARLPGELRQRRPGHDRQHHLRVPLAGRGNPQQR